MGVDDDGQGGMGGADIDVNQIFQMFMNQRGGGSFGGGFGGGGDPFSGGGFPFGGSGFRVHTNTNFG